MSYFLLITLPFLAFILINSHFTSKDLEEKAKFSSEQIFTQGLSSVEFRIAILKTYMNVLSVNDKIQDIVKKDITAYKENIGLWYYDINDIRKQFVNANPSTDITNVRLYVNSAVTEIDETIDMLKMSRILKTDWYKKLTSENNTFVWFRDQEKVIQPGSGELKLQKYISTVRVLQSNENLKEILGLIKIDIREKVFKDILERVAILKNSSAYLVNSKNEIIATSAKTEPSRFFFAPQIVNKHTKYELGNKNGVWENLKLDKESYLVGIHGVAGTDWNMIITIPHKEILASQSKVMKQMLLIILFIAPLTLPLAFFGAASGTKRIRHLISHMKSVQKGVFNISILSSSRDEIGELTRNFNTMITKISILLDEKYSLGQELKSIELKALQAQINPHFLYNTLDLIYWKALRIKEDSIYELVQSLSKFYKLSLSGGNDIVTLENEVEHIQAYVQIQNARFKNGIALIIDIPKELYQYKLPKITLQPIIENSITHGILEKEDEKGTIRITGHTNNNNIVLEITDDGVGIPKEKLLTILDSSPGDAFHGYGINNINKRIKLLYGEDYSLTYFSEQGCGTTVRIVLPIEQNGISE